MKSVAWYPSDPSVLVPPGEVEEPEIVWPLTPSVVVKPEGSVKVVALAPAGDSYACAAGAGTSTSERAMAQIKATGRGGAHR